MTATNSPAIPALLPIGSEGRIASSNWTTSWTGPRRGLPAVALAGVCIAGAFSPIGVDDGPVLCPYRFVTGGWCPGCGGTRAVRAMLRADLGHAISLNPWAALVFVQVALFVSAIAAAPVAASRLWRRHRNAVLAVNAAIAILAWFARMGFGVIPTPFS